MRQDHEAKGHAAAEALLGLLEGEAQRPVRVIAHRLVVRGSSGPAPA